MKRAVRLPDSASILASAKTDFSSDTLVVTAEIDLKRRPAASARSRAIDVFPLPGPPQKTIDEKRPAASIRPHGRSEESRVGHECCSTCRSRLVSLYTKKNTLQLI